MHRILIVFITTIFLSGCGSGYYSIIFTNSGVQHQGNKYNELPGHYKKREIIVPYSILEMSDEKKKELNEELQGLQVYTVKAKLKSTAKSVIVELPKCDKKGIAIIRHSLSKVKMCGKIYVEFQYVCMKDFDKNVWATTEKYLINGKDDCGDGFHTVEFIFNSSDQELKRVLVICANP